MEARTAPPTARAAAQATVRPARLLPLALPLLVVILELAKASV